jgi:hypothetical protein
MHISLFINNMYSYTTILDMFRALTCPSSGGPIVFSQHLVTPLSVNGCSCTVHQLRADFINLVNEIILYYDARSKKNIKLLMFVSYLNLWTPCIWKSRICRLYAYICSFYWMGKEHILRTAMQLHLCTNVLVVSVYIPSSHKIINCTVH